MRWIAWCVLAVACSGSTSGDPGPGYDESWGSDVLAGGKADGIFDTAAAISFKERGTGHIGRNGMAVFYIDLKGGDLLEATMKVRSGDLSPHLTLYRGLSHHVSSESWSHDGTVLIKKYKIAESARHYLVARPYQNSGAGDFDLSLKCLGGPCAGELVAQPLDDEDAGFCIMRARECALKELPKYNGIVGPTRSRTIFQTCLAAGTVEHEPTSCKAACDEQDGSEHDRGALCESIIAALPFYADQSAPCVAEVKACMSDCYYSGGADMTTLAKESVCFLEGLNGTCHGYAQEHKLCGGSYADGSNEQCHALCRATDGAWKDDLDTICSDKCQ
jgi:hypothetical protein